MTSMSKYKSIVDKYITHKEDFELFMEGVVSFFIKSQRFNGKIHSVKYRLKDHDHLRLKIARKKAAGDTITKDNLFSEITDLAGVRVLHLYHDQFQCIHNGIMDRVRAKDWVMPEKPVAYTWDPEYVPKFKQLGLRTQKKQSLYTSSHYIVKPNKDSYVSCEIQVRTLFEEVWGEIDHSFNYPTPTKIASCKEQIMVLAKLVGAGTRLVDSIYKSTT